MATIRQSIKGALGEARSIARSLRTGHRSPPSDDLRYFVLFGRGRTGSSLLVDLIDNHPEATCLGELLNKPRVAPLAYARRELAGATGTRRGFKLLSYQARTLIGDRSRRAIRDWMGRPDVTVFHLRRDNTLRHAISNIYARERQAFHSTNTRTGPQSLPLDFDQLMYWMDKSSDMLAWESLYLDGIDAEPVSYEDDLAVPQAQSNTLKRVLDRLGLDPIEARSGLRPVTPRSLEDLVPNWAEIATRLKATPYARFAEEAA